MRIQQNIFKLSATDLANHLACRHLTTLNNLLARGELTEPAWEDPHAIVLRQRGLEHERAYVESLRSRGLSVVDLSAEPEATAAEAVWRAMQSGVQAIVQGSLSTDGWRGRADVMLRVERPSRLGEWSYEVVDCKLSRATKAGTILQLCLYSELLGALQVAEPEYFHVIRPGVGFEPESYRFSSFSAYARTVKDALSRAVQSGPAETYPEPVTHCDVCRWWRVCDAERRADDHLSFVAGASRLQRKELTAQGVPTLQALAVLPLPIPFKPARGAVEGYFRIREQARIQYEARIDGQLKYESLPVEPGKGLARLPSPSAGDIFLDFEGDPFVGEGGLEYLTGIVTATDDGALLYECRWALDRAQEKSAFEWLIDFTCERMTRFADLHIYHFGSYEPSAVKRLMLRYATREDEVDRLLRGEVFVNLHTILKQGIRASVEQYSLKDIEKFCAYQRSVPLPEANQARHFVENQLELSAGRPDLTDQARKTVQGYNEDDCGATEGVRNWLETIRAAMIASGADLPRPTLKDPAPSEKGSAQKQRVAAVFEALTRDLPSEPADRSPDQAAKWLLAHALDWHGREDKVKWWEFFRMKDLSEEELYDQKSALAGLSFIGRMLKRSPREQAPIDQYQYPAQECSIRRGDEIYTFDEKRFGEVVAADPVARTVAIKKLMKLDAVHPPAVFAYSYFGTKEQSNSILRVADWIVANGIDGAGDFRAARDLLLRNRPRLPEGQSLTAAPGEDIVDVAWKVGLALDESVLPIQGPPGSGKTATGSRMICELVKRGRKIGISATSHAVIVNLLGEVVETARKMGITEVACAHRKTESDENEAENAGIGEIGSNEEALAGLQSGVVNVLGATAWLWSREEFMNSVDVLFVDEAGQMSLANVLACAPAGRNLVLLGDPQQLEQPQTGTHPESSGISALAHLLNGRKTVADDRGLFLPETWRLQPAICRFTSEMFYEGRLASREGLERQRIAARAPFSGAGLWYLPVVHEGNRSYSVEEIERVAGLIEFLTEPGSSLTDSQGVKRPLTRTDILCVAPYNDQVDRLKERLPGVQVGTVDKFQGQQAAVVIYSMTASSPEDAPRGMGFLYDLNRFNVATSRARCACIVVSSPILLSPDCKTPRQMEMANLLCRYSEMAEHISIGAAAAIG
jgi:predicted RecB family nuclease